MRKGEKNPWFGKHPSEETRQKMIDVWRLRKENGYGKEQHPLYGKPHSEEARKKMSDTHKKQYAHRREMAMLAKVEAA